MEMLFEHYAKVKVRPSSHQTYRGYIDNHIKPNIGKVPLEKLTPLELQKFYKKLLEQGRAGRLESRHQAKGLSPKTVRNIHQIISSAMNLAREQKPVSYTHLTLSRTAADRQHGDIITLRAEWFKGHFREADLQAMYLSLIHISWPTYSIVHSPGHS